MVKIPLIYEDSYICVFNKPHGIPVNKDLYDIGRPHLTGILEKQYGKLYVVHRLDAGTSGLIILAKDKKSCRDFSDLFDNRDILKEYLAVVKGRFPSDISCILPISKKNYHGTYKVSYNNSRQCRSTFYVERNSDRLSVLRCELHTGRTHQLRVHLQALKHPLFVDYQYNKNTKKWNKDLTLMCRKLSFIHPITKEKIELKIPNSKFISEIISKYFED